MFYPIEFTESTYESLTLRLLEAGVLTFYIIIQMSDPSDQGCLAACIGLSCLSFFSCCDPAVNNARPGGGGVCTKCCSGCFSSKIDDGDDFDDPNLEWNPRNAQAPQSTPLQEAAPMTVKPSN
ncbi:hypothetical protein OF83DRAFT_74524 [Amylostereum chailletii]|nr:hypothetical protein OF83DRAFT_74524 [Amylostereum chailletii]